MMNIRCLKMNSKDVLTKPFSYVNTNTCSSYTVIYRITLYINILTIWMETIVKLDS